MYCSSREKRKAPPFVVNVEAGECKKVFYSIMEARWHTEKRTRFERRLCNVKKESALAAHRQIGRMLHNHYQVHGTGFSQVEFKT